MKIGFFEESPGNHSIMRLVFFIGVVWGILFTTVYSFYCKLPVGEVIAMATGLLSLFLAAKLIQKPMEVKDSNPNKIQDTNNPPT